MKKVVNNSEINSSQIMSKKRTVKDILRNVSTLVFSILTLGILIWIIIYIFVTGAPNLSWSFITSDYNETSVSLRSESDFTFDGRDFTFEDPNGFKSERWGVSFIDGKNNLGEDVIFFNEICENSYFYELIDYSTNEVFLDYNDQYVYSMNLMLDNGTYQIVNGNRYSAEELVSYLDQAYLIDNLNIMTVGGGIRGSILTTLTLIGVTLIIALPIGIIGAIYLALFAKKNKITMVLRSLIDMTSAIPSIIFGFIGAIIFIPFVNSITGSSGGSILSGAFTLAIMLIPTIVKTTEESILALPKGYMDSSLALGASRTETVFKVILPNAVPGIITSAILSIGRIIGESAALVFAIGASIQDNVSLTNSSTSLAVHIWVLLSHENPNYDAACAISIIILIIVLILSLLTKLISYLHERKLKRSR